MASLFRESAVTSGRDEVYVAAVPLRATKGPAQLLMSATYSLNFWDLQHFMVIIKPSSPRPHFQVFKGFHEISDLNSQQEKAFAFDFQPKDPENVYVALAALSGRAVPGAALVRQLTKLPRRKCWFVGSSEVDAVDRARKFNDSWETDLSVGHHDCRDYTNGLVENLTGEKYVLERLRKSHDGRS